MISKCEMNRLQQAEEKATAKEWTSTILIIREHNLTNISVTIVETELYNKAWILKLMEDGLQ